MQGLEKKNEMTTNHRQHGGFRFCTQTVGTNERV